MKKLLLSAIVILGFTAVSFGQSTAKANAQAVLLTPLTINSSQSMDFGILGAVQTDGSATIDVAGLLSVTNVNKVSGTPKQAIFNVAGEPSQAISVTLPTTSTVIALSTGGASPSTLNLSSFTNDLPSSPLQLNSFGNLVINIGATLSVPANSPK